MLLYGGSFDPPHAAHVELAVAARDALEQSEGLGIWLVYVPAARSPHKPAGPVASGAQRARMLELALEARPRAAIWTDEIDRAVVGEPSYWINTVRRARAVRGEGAWLRFLIGADQAVEFHRWREAREILQAADAVVIGRGSVDSAPALRAAMAGAAFWSEAELDAWARRFIDVGTRRAASTDVRGGDEGDVAPAVAAYIEREGLYGGGGGGTGFQPVSP